MSLPDSPLVAFHRDRGHDGRGRMREEILAWNDAALEAVHDYVQWLFPLPEASRFNPDAPVLTAADIAAFADDPALRGHLRQALERMLAFYGFHFSRGGDQGGDDGGETEETIEPDESFATRRHVWLTAGNHNLLRLNRILRCLRILGLEAEALALFTALDRVYQGEGKAAIGEVSHAFWKQAAGLKLGEG